MDADGHLDLLAALSAVYGERGIDGVPVVEHAGRIRRKLEDVMARAAQTATKILRRELLRFERAERYQRAFSVRLLLSDEDPVPDDEDTETLLMLTGWRLGCSYEDLLARMAERIGDSKHLGDKETSGPAKAAASIVGKIEGCSLYAIERASLRGPVFDELAKLDYADDRLRARGSLTKLALQMGSVPPIPRRRSEPKK